MEIVMVNKQFERVGLIDNAHVIWTSRYYKCGDFELYMPATQRNLDLLYQSYFVVRDEDEDNAGIIEDIKMTNSPDEGSMITVTGRFTPMILGKRIISQQTQLKGDFQNSVRNLVTTNVINPTKTERKIKCIALGEFNTDLTEKLEMQTTGNNLLEKIEETCEALGVGFKMPLRKNKIYFEMYKGIDRSYNQMENPWIIFSDEYDNVAESEYEKKTSEYKNVFLIAAEGEGINRRQLWGASSDNETEITDLDRNEVYVDQRNMSSNDENITEEEYLEQMKSEGKDNLTYITETFAGAVILSNYKYGKPENGGDLFLGDVVTIKNTKWNIYMNTRIVEVIESEDNNGKVITLTFGI